MITISACMIVKNEERVLGRCLEAIKNLVDEIIIVDTGSTDGTKKIAAEYTDKVYDFTWKGDFAAARNASFEKAAMEYIYVADADEVVDAENQRKFLQMKEVLLPEIEIVQMHYVNQLQFNTTYNFDREYRPKLYRRLRTFQWEEPLHEAVRLAPVIWDSDIEILHMPEKNHAPRDFGIYREAIKRDGGLSARLKMMYARELYIAGTGKDFKEALPYFLKVSENADITEEGMKLCQCVIARAARLQADSELFFSTALHQSVTGEPSSELCCEIGQYYMEKKNYGEAALWFDAAMNGEAVLDIHCQEELPKKWMEECLKQRHSE